MKVDKKERTLLESVERGEWRPTAGVKQHLSRCKRYARAHAPLDRGITVRISSKDLQAIQARAIEKGLPYQALVSRLLHKYACGRLR
jgi:predicted DNA binding CopG/RHH family protein